MAARMWPAITSRSAAGGGGGHALPGREEACTDGLQAQWRARHAWRGPAGPHLSACCTADSW